MVDDLLADLVEAGLLGQQRHVAVHLAVDLNGLYDIGPVGLEPAIKVVKLDA